ncbi:MAG: hypothetical protein RL338_366 [Chloroflexota bacterium]|jgi:nucleoside 2-deoxyribosyltransferase
MRIYFAGPLFTSAEREWNERLRDRLVAAGHEVFLPQEQEFDATTPQQTFESDVRHVDWSEALVAIMDGEDPDSGTCWEVGYAYAKGKPIVMIRTDFRSWGEPGDPYNLMLTRSATLRYELPIADMETVAATVLGALASLRRG